MDMSAEEMEDESLFEDDEFSLALDSTAEMTQENMGDITNQPAIAKEESRALSMVRFVVFFILNAVTAGVAVGVYFYVSNTETSSFEDDFRDSSDKAFDAIGSVFDQSLGASDSLMGMMVSIQEHDNTSWPFVTLPDFAVKAQKLLTLSRASVIGIYPRVLHQDRAEWEAYGKEHQGWVDESLAIQKDSPNFKGTNLDSYFDYPHIHTNDGIAPDSSFYYPTWQASPVVPRWGGKCQCTKSMEILRLSDRFCLTFCLLDTAWGSDLMTFFSSDVLALEASRSVIMGKTVNLPPILESDVEWIADRVGTEDIDPSEPYFSFYYPIVQSATDAVSVPSLEPKSHPVVGLVATTIFWRKIFENLLAPGTKGLVAVIGSPCKQTLTYEINGPDVSYLGPGDLHDSEYNKYERFSYLATLGSKALRERQYTGFPIDEDYCPYWIRLYPSDKMKDEHESNDPIIFTVVAVSIFVFTAVFFLVYDCVSERRQQKVMQVAQQSAAVVSNLFPQVVRDRMFSAPQKPKSAKEHVSTAKVRLQQFLHNDDEAEAVGGGAQRSENAPIAELFSDTTVSKWATL